MAQIIYLDFTKQTADQKEGMGAFLEKRKHEPYQNK